MSNSSRVPEPAIVNRYIQALVALTKHLDATIRAFARDLIATLAQAPVAETLEPLINLPLNALTPQERLLRMTVSRQGA